MLALVKSTLYLEIQGCNFMSQNQEVRTYLCHRHSNEPVRVAPSSDAVTNEIQSIWLDILVMKRVTRKERV